MQALEAARMRFPRLLRGTVGDFSVSDAKILLSDSDKKTLADAERDLDKYERDGQKLLDAIKASGRAGAEAKTAETLEEAVRNANERDEQGYKDARASLIETSRSIGPFLAVFPPALIAWGAATALALGMMEALKSIGLEKLRVGRASGAYDDEWIETAGARADALLSLGLPFPVFNEKQHVNPREYAGYLQGQTIGPIDSLDAAHRELLNDAGRVVGKWKGEDPAVTLLWSKAATRPFGWAYYAHATDGAPLLTYRSDGVEPEAMIDLLALAALRQYAVSPAFFEELTDGGQKGWNQGIAEATPGSGAFHYGRGPQALADAWSEVKKIAEAHAETAPRKDEPASGSGLGTTIAVGAVAGLGLLALIFLL
jgi:hypothetical protein